jgi:hypothetical protein
MLPSNLALDLAKARNPRKFAALALRAFGRVCYLQQRHTRRDWPENIFAEGALCEFWEWRPEAWCIPDNEELGVVEQLLTEAVQKMETFHAGLNTKWYFSAASVAIKYCTLSRFPTLNAANDRQCTH